MMPRMPLILVPALLLWGCSEQPPPPPKPLPAPAPGRVRVTSVPAGAAVFVDGQRQDGKTPLVVERPAFKRLELVVIKDGYELFQTFRLVESGAEVSVHAKLQPKQGMVIVRSGPVRGAVITIDGVERGKTPSRLPLVAGQQHLIHVSKEGFVPWQQPVSLSAGETRELLVALVPHGRLARSMGWLTLEADQEALVFLNNAPLGKTPLAKLPLPAKRYDLLIKSLNSKHSKRIKVTIKPKQERTVRVRLKR